MKSLTSKQLSLYLSLVFILLTGCNNQMEQSVQPSTDLDVEAQAVVIPQQEANVTVSGVDAIIPSGWRLFERTEGEAVQAEGDLNQDDIPDLAAVLEKITDGSEEAPPRALLIAFGSEDGSYTLSILAEQVIMKSDEGGVWGDPLESIAIDRGSVVVSHYGGSNWRWYNKHRFRYQDQDWVLIGQTLGHYFTGSQTQDDGNEEDYNLLTGEYVIRTTDEHGVQSIQQGNRGRSPLIKLKDFSIEKVMNGQQ